MKCLAVDTSGEHLTVVYIDDNFIISEYSENVNLRHSITLMPSVESVLKKAGVSISDIDVFASVLGPGSFTGIRIGVSTMKAFSYANDKKVLPLTSFDVLAYNKENGKYLAVIDAKRDNYYVQGYDGKEVCLSPRFLCQDEVLKLSKEYEILSSIDTPFCKANCSLEKGLISAVKSKLENATFDRETLIPLYVRKSQAEESL